MLWLGILWTLSKVAMEMGSCLIFLDLSAACYILLTVMCACLWGFHCTCTAVKALLFLQTETENYCMHDFDEWLSTGFACGPIFYIEYQVANK